MPRVVVTVEARRELSSLVRSRHLPPDTYDRVRKSFEPLASHPLIGPAARGAEDGHRFVLGPWPWMLIVYRYDAGRDTVVVVTIQDARSGGAAPSDGT